MARIRTIKPEFFTSLTIAELTVEQRLTFIGLWTHVDDEGRCIDDARLVRSAVWTLSDRTPADVEHDLFTLNSLGLITRYRVNRKPVLAVRGWREHQRVDKPKPSTLPAPDQASEQPETATPVQYAQPPTSMNTRFVDTSTTNPGRLPDQSRTDPGSVNAGEEQGRERNREGNREERSAREPSATTAAAVNTGPRPLTQLPADWQPADSDTAAGQQARLDAGHGTLTRRQLDTAARKFARHMRAESKRSRNWGSRWQDWIESERATDEPGTLPATTGAKITHLDAAAHNSHVIEAARARIKHRTEPA